MFMSILSSLNSFQIIPHVFIIYYKHYLDTLKIYNIDIFLNVKTWKNKHCLQLLWYVLPWLHLKLCIYHITITIHCFLVHFYHVDGGVNKISHGSNHVQIINPCVCLKIKFILKRKIWMNFFATYYYKY
jgi:hypothetical protein